MMSLLIAPLAAIVIGNHGMKTVARKNQLDHPFAANNDDEAGRFAPLGL
jgi:hypothetical protein